MIRNDTQDTYQMRVRVGKTDLEGEWRVSAEPTERYAVVERSHEMRAQYWAATSATTSSTGRRLICRASCSRRRLSP